MLAINYSELRNKMKFYMDKISNDFETMVITRKGKNVVMLSEESYNNLIENLYIMSDKTNYERLMQSLSQVPSATVHDLVIDDE